MSRPLTLGQIVQGGLCIGCGLCESVAGADRVTMAMTASGRERPIVRGGPLDRGTLQRINAVCPGTTIAGGPAALEVDPVWGPLVRVVEGHASDPQTRHQAASGGVLTALGRFLLDSGRVELVLHVAASRTRPMRSVAQVSYDRAAVLHGSGSRYGPVAPLHDLGQILDAGQPFALIGKPCDVTAARALGRVDPRVGELMRYALAMVCGGASDLRKSAEVLDRFGVREDELTLFRYRGFGNPGRNRVETADERRFELTYQEMWDDERGWRLQSRCKICPDAIGESADIVAGDMFPDGEPPDDDPGFNSIMVRTAAGAELLDAAVAAGEVTIRGPVAVRDLDGFNPHQVVKKRAVAARLAGIALAGGPVPRVRGLRILRLAGGAGWRANLRELRGAYRRSRSGRFGEPPPVAQTM